MKKKVWFFNQNSYLPEDGPHIRHFTLGKYLVEDGYEAYVFAGNELHHNGRRIDTEGERYIEKIRDGVHFFYIKTHHYEKTDIHRIFNIFSYYNNLFKVVKNVKLKYGKPDVIYASSMYPTALVAGIKLAKEYGIKCISENRDIIPEGFITTGTVKENSLISVILRAFMKRIYEKSDALVFTMSGGKQYILEKKYDRANGGKVEIDKVYYINNGVDLSIARQNEKKYILDDSDLDDPTLFKVVYLGAIRFMNQMPLFIETASELKDRGRDDIKILMWGNGTKLDEMREALKEKGLNNIVLKGYVDKQYIPSIAKRANLFVGTGNSSSVGKYGMSFNKLFDYLAGGKPVILPFKVAGSIVEANNAGTELENATAKSLADEIIRYADMPEREYNGYCFNTEQLVRKYDYRVLVKQVEEIIETV